MLLGSSAVAHVPQLPTGQGQGGFLFPAIWLLAGLWWFVLLSSSSCSSPRLLLCSWAPVPFFSFFFFPLFTMAFVLQRGHMTHRIDRKNGSISNSDTEMQIKIDERA